MRQPQVGDVLAFGSEAVEIFAQLLQVVHQSLSNSLIPVFDRVRSSTCFTITAQ